MKVSLALLAGFVATASANMGNCDEQAACMEFTIEEHNGGDCGGDPDGCFYEICMIYANFDGCPKGGDAYSHTCLKDPNQCQDADGFNSATKYEDGEGVLKAGGTQCQKVMTGKTAEFYIKDGRETCGEHVKTYTLEHTYTARCDDLVDLQDLSGNNLDNCGGNANSHLACVWRVTAPLTCTEAPIVTDAPVLITTTPATTTTTASAATGATTTTTTTPAATDPTTTTTTPAATDATTTTTTPGATDATTTTTTPGATDATTVATTTTTTTGDFTPNTNGGGGGDPHFNRWGREHESFHGECDLVLVHSDKFHNGAGFDLHARTTIQDYFSYIETAALQVGDNNLQFYRNKFYLNGVEMTPEDLPVTFGGDFKYTVSKAQIEEGKNERFYQYYKVDLHEDSSILFKFYKEYLTMDISGNPSDFTDSVGLLGSFPEGHMISREGKTMDDFVTYGFEWQVNPDDKKIFKDDRSPQLPYEQCRMPTAARPARRALRRDEELVQAASEACAHVKGTGYDLCVDDVMSVGDVGLAGLW